MSKPTKKQPKTPVHIKQTASFYVKTGGYLLWGFYPFSQAGYF